MADETIVQLSLPAGMVQTIRASLLTAAVAIDEVMGARVYVSPSERRAFAQKLIEIADAGQLIDQQVARQGVRELQKH